MISVMNVPSIPEHAEELVSSIKAQVEKVNSPELYASFYSWVEHLVGFLNDYGLKIAANELSKIKQAHKEFSVALVQKVSRIFTSAA